jgi:hypothetical protein
VAAMVSENILRDTESSYYMIENEKGSSFPVTVKRQHSFDPLNEVVDYYDDIMMSLDGRHVTCSEINPPLGEGTNNNNWEHRSRVCPHLSIEDLTWVTLLDCLNIIFY